MRAVEQFFNELGKNSEEVLALLQEAAEMISYYRRLLERLERDDLTGLPGNNKFRDFIKDIETYASSVGVIFFDVNDLKDNNDTKGHRAGDLLIQKAAESIILTCEDNTHAFRVGGDEFVVIITNCAENDIDEFLTKWRGNLDALNATGDGIHCSVAAGAALGSGQYQTSDILKLADERMYSVKRRMKTMKEQ